jgi:sugar phosphate permease
MAMTLFLTAFFHRVAPAVMTEEIMADLKIGAWGLGNLSAFYFYIYVALQIPSGILVDSWGPRRLLTIGSLVSGLGAMVFSLAPSFFWACWGRGLIGGATAVAFVSLLKIAASWLPARQFALSSGIGLFCGVLGGIAAGVPLRFFIDHFGWRTAMFGSGMIAASLGLAIWLLVRDDPSAYGFRSYASPLAPPARSHPRPRPWKGFAWVLANRNAWLLSFGPAALVGSPFAFSGLWGVPFLKIRFSLHESEAAALCSLLLVCWAIGGPLLGWLSDRMGRRKPLYLLGTSIAAAGWTAMVLLPSLPLSFFVFFLLLTGLGSGVNIIGFAFAKESLPLRLSGTVTGFVNMGNMSGSMLLPPLIGWAMDRMWMGQMAGGKRIYDLAAFEAGFLWIVGGALLSCGAALFTRETHCRQMD